MKFDFNFYKHLSFFRLVAPPLNRKTVFCKNFFMISINFTPRTECFPNHVFNWNNFFLILLRHFSLCTNINRHKQIFRIFTNPQNTFLEYWKFFCKYENKRKIILGSTTGWADTRVERLWRRTRWATGIASRILMINYTGNGSRRTLWSWKSFSTASRLRWPHRTPQLMKCSEHQTQQSMRMTRRSMSSERQAPEIVHFLRWRAWPTSSMRLKIRATVD